MGVLKFNEEGRIIVPIVKVKKMETKQERRKRLTKQRHLLFENLQEESMPTATKNKQSYEDWELKEILNCGDKNYDKMLELAKKFNRRWWAIKTIIEDRDYYLKNGENKLTIRNDNFGKQLKRIIDSE